MPPVLSDKLSSMRSKMLGKQTPVKLNLQEGETLSQAEDRILKTHPENFGQQNYLAPMTAPAISPALKQALPLVGGDVKAAKELGEANKANSLPEKQIDETALTNQAINGVGILAREFQRMQNQGSIPEKPYLEGGIPAGNVRGVMNVVEGALKTNPAAHAYPSALMDHAATLARLVTGGVRAPESVTQKIVESNPDRGATWQSFAEQNAIQLHQAAAKQAARLGQVYDPIAMQPYINKELKPYMPEGEYKKFEDSFSGEKLKSVVPQEEQPKSEAPIEPKTEAAPEPKTFGITKTRPAIAAPVEVNPLAAAAAAELARRKAK